MSNLANSLSVNNIAKNTITPNIFDQLTVDDFISRINQLQPNVTALWGKMNVSQMLKHCSDCTKMSFGTLVLKRPLIGKLLGPIFLKSMAKNDNRIKKNEPTHPLLKIKETASFEEEKNNLIKLVTQYASKNPMELENRVHPFFGKMTSVQWSIWVYKHLDHHLRQFGV